MTASEPGLHTGSLDDPVQSVRGVGPARLKALNAAGIRTVSDLLRQFPRRHRLLPAATTLDDSPDGCLTTLVGTVDRAVHRSGRRRRGGHLHVQLLVGNDKVSLEFFNQGYLRSTITPGQHMRVSGVLRRDPAPVMTPVHYRVGESVTEEPLFLCDYRVPAGVKPGQYASLVRDSWAGWGQLIPDPLPAEIIQGGQHMPLADAVREIHFPESPSALRRACARLSYNAFLVAALSAESARAQEGHFAAGPIPRDEEREIRCAGVLPFTLTQGQSAALDEILADLGAARPMRRLIQGDVGCGKTAVAGQAVLNAVLAGGQAAVLAPTEVLARQLYHELSQWGRKVGIKTELLVGGMKAAERRRALTAIEEGASSVAVGTHALFQSPVAFRELSLVVVDEQHRFGVLQRLRLVRKGRAPHLLAMSATPIPRTLAMTVYSDLKLSSIRERPAGRRPVTTTHHVRELDGPFDWRDLAERAAAGEKTFVVFPGIESDVESFPSLLGLGRELARRYFRKVSVAAVHGRMADREKQEKLEAFRNGTVQVLFATTVIEVGVDVPDAVNIVIVGADRFGLAQLHQLRGRVGRGARPGACYLLTRTRKSAESERLALLCACHDGFTIAERDLELRGPGDMMGLKQHGPGPLSSPVDDESLLHEAFRDARRLLDEGRDIGSLVEILGRYAWHRQSRSRRYMDAG